MKRLAKNTINKIKLQKMHKHQQEILDNHKRFNVICCGRRFGKNILLNNLVAIASLEGKRVAVIEPTYKMVGVVWRDINKILEPAITSANGSEMRIELNTQGTIDFWSLETYESIRGRKYHLVIINEAASFRHLEQAWLEVIRPTLTDYEGECWFFSTPKGKNFFEELFEREKTHENWYSVRKTSYDNPKIKSSEIDEARLELPELVFRQEYLAEFVSGAGTMLSKEHIKYYDDVDESSLELTMGVDLAISSKETSDYTVIVVLGKNKISGNIYIISVTRQRMSFNETLEKIKSVYAKYKPKMIGIESVAYQAVAVQELLRTTTLPVKSIHVDKDKVTRFQNILARFEHGYVYIKNDITKDYTDELLSFPLGNHDDMVDATAHAFNLLAKPQGFMF